MTAGIFAAAICLAQEQPATPGLAQLLKQLRSSQWTDRAEAYEKLSSDSKLLSNHRVQKELLNLLGRESGYLRPKPDDISHEQDEAFAEYVGVLGDTVDSFADWNDPSQVCVLVHQGYDPESPFAAELAAHGKIALPCLMRMFRHDVGLVRAEIAPVIVQALAKTTGLDEKTIEAAKGLILKALHDPEEAARINTIEALKWFGGEDMIPALKQIAQSDPAPEVDGYSIRKWAVEAAAAIEKRAGR
jgi:hypothetical protein